MGMSVYVDFGKDRIRTTIATRQEEVDYAIKSMIMSSFKNPKRLIGLDIITKRLVLQQGFISELRIHTLQLYDGSDCLIIRFTCGNRFPESLYNFFSLPSFTFAVFGVKETMARLKNCNIVCKNVLEVGPAGWYRLNRFPTISPMVNELASMYVLTGDGISEVWDIDKDLTEDMIKICVSNVLGAFNIGDEMFKIRSRKEVIFSSTLRFAIVLMIVFVISFVM